MGKPRLTQQVLSSISIDLNPAPSTLDQLEFELIGLSILRICDQLEFNAHVKALATRLDEVTKYQSRKESTLREHKEMFKIMKSLDKVCRESENREEKPPSYLEYAQLLGSHGYWGSHKKHGSRLVSEKTLREIKKQGRENHW